MDFQRFNTLTYKVHEYHSEKAWMRFEKAGFKPILIKGWAAGSQFYTEPVKRRYNDIDLIIEPDRYDEAIEFLKNFTENIAIDLYKGVRQLDTFNNYFSSIKVNLPTPKTLRLPFSCTNTTNFKFSFLQAD